MCPSLGFRVPRIALTTGLQGKQRGSTRRRPTDRGKASSVCNERRGEQELCEQMTSSAAGSRIQQLLKLRSTIWQTTYNPENLRTGAKYLKANLRGPAMLRYYPERPPKLSAMRALFPDLAPGVIDPLEQQRLDDIEAKRRRGKGAPKKGQGRRSTMKKK